MDYIKQLPYILATSMSIIIGLISFFLGIDDREIYIRIITAIILFYSIGLFIRFFINNIIKETEKSSENDNDMNNKELNEKTVDSTTNEQNEDDTEEWKSLHETVEKVREL